MERFGKYIMEYIDKNMLPFITGAIGVFVPGMLTIFLFNRTIFMKIDIIIYIYRRTFFLLVDGYWLHTWRTQRWKFLFRMADCVFI